MEPKSKTILITGAEGLVGSILRRGLSRRYHLLALTRTPQEFESRVVDIETASHHCILTKIP
jgi:NAD dependent epimerase/dehydratase family enzyme